MHTVLGNDMRAKGGLSLYIKDEKFGRLQTCSGEVLLVVLSFYINP